MESSKVNSSERVTAVQQTKRSEESRQAQERVNQQRAAEAKKSGYDQPKPTTNSQGQRIGENLSVRA